MMTPRAVYTVWGVSLGLGVVVLVVVTVLLELIDAGATHLVLAPVPPWPDRPAQWLADEQLQGLATKARANGPGLYLDLPLGDFGQADRRAVAVTREVDHRHHGIASLGAELHGPALATRGRTCSGGGSAGVAASRSRSSSATLVRSAATSSSSAVSGRAIGSGISPLMP